MVDIDTEIRADLEALLDAFMRGVTEIARRAARETLRDALQAVAPLDRPPVVAPGSAPNASSARARAKGEKRPPAELANLGDRLRVFIEQHPGLRSEQINAALGTTRRDVMLPLKKLVTAGVVRADGEKRSTRYYPAKPQVASPAAEATRPASGPRVRRKN